MPNLLKRAQKKIADSLWDRVFDWLWLMLATFISTASGALILFLRSAPHPRLIAALIGASIALAFSIMLPLTIVIVKVIRERRSGKPNRAERRRVAEIVIADKSRMKDLVMICGTNYDEIVDGRKPVYLEFGFSILNMSLYNISVESVEGTINFYLDGETYTPILKPRLQKKEKASNLGFRSNGYFVVEQHFETADERKYVLGGSPDDTIFFFNPLTITFTGDDFDPVRLRPDISFRKCERRWVANYDADFAFIGIAEAKARIQELEAQIGRVERPEQP